MASGQTTYEEDELLKENEILEEIVSIMQGITNLYSRPKGQGTNLAEADRQTTFVIGLSSEEYYVSLEPTDEDYTPRLPTPLIAVSFDFIDYLENHAGRIDKISPDIMIDVVASHLDIKKAKDEALLIQKIIRRVFKDYRNINGLVSYVHVRRIQRLGFLLKENFPFEYGYRAFLTAKTY